MDLTRKRITGFVGTGLATLGFILFLSGWATAGSKWDSEDCCQNADKCDSYCAGLGCLSRSSSDNRVFQDPQDETCCYEISTSGPGTGDLIFGLIGIGVVVVTILILECGDKICCECCQKCTACILGFQNILGLISMILIIVFLTAKEDGSDGCEASMYDTLGVMGLMVAGCIFLTLGIVCAIVASFIECCCDDSEQAGGMDTKTASM